MRHLLGFESMKNDKPPTPVPAKVLVVLHANGWIEVRSDLWINLRFVHRLDVDEDDVETCDLADRIVKLQTPRWFRRLLESGRYLRGFEQVRRISPEQEARRQDALDSMDSMRRFNDWYRRNLKPLVYKLNEEEPHQACENVVPCFDHEEETLEACDNIIPYFDAEA